MGLASIMVRLGLDASGYQIGLKKVEGATSRWGSGLASSIKGRLAAAFSVAALAQATRSVVMWADSIKDASDDLGISTTALQEWEYAAEGTRATLQDFIRAFQYLAKINPDLNNAQVLERFNGLAAAFKRGEVTLGDLQKNLGRGAAVLIGPFSKGLKESADQARALNRFLSEDQVNALSRVADGWDKAKGYAKAYFAQALIGTKNLLEKMQEFNEKAGTPMFGYGVAPRNVNGTPRVQPTALEPFQYEPEPGEMLSTQTAERQRKDTIERTASSKWSTLGVTANQQIGAFIGGQPVLLTEIKEHTRLLKKIEQNTEETAEAVN